MIFYKQLLDLIEAPKGAIWELIKTTNEHLVLKPINRVQEYWVKKDTKVFEPVPHTVVYTDGACRNNGSPNALGAFAYIVQTPEQTFKYAKAIPATTNNRMELTAVIGALEKLQKNDHFLTIYSDSIYVVKGATEWLSNWKKKNFKNVKNPDLWKRLDTLLQARNCQTRFIHVKAHADNEYNNAADALCNHVMNTHLQAQKDKGETK